MERENLNKSIKEIFASQYVIPLYQRNYAWRREEISTLLADVWEAYDQSPDSHYFIGSLVVRKRADQLFEVIDGQQRLTTLSLVAKLLGIVKERHLSYDSRPHAEEFLDALYSDENLKEYSHPSVKYIRDAVDIIRQANLKESIQGNGTLSISDAGDNFAKYFANNVILVRVEIPEDTEVETYFEIMNNRGEQLQEHEILKSLMVRCLDKEKQKEFSLIWDACSQMDLPVQKAFNANLRRRYFGEDFSGFHFNGLSATDEALDSDSPLTIDQILAGETQVRVTAQSKEESVVFVDDEACQSIIDFPNFLMHILKMTALKGNDSNVVQLDSRYLLSSYAKLKPADREGQKLFAEDFIKRLFMSKVFFDRYIPKTSAADSSADDESVKWVLKRLECSNRKLYPVETFTDRTQQERILMALSMLQVTYRTRRYKRWLQEALLWFEQQYSVSGDINVLPQDYIAFLDKYILGCFSEFKEISQYAAKGTDTPHFILNFIDYLYWVESREKRNNIAYSHLIEDFDFKYWNSVEHHLSQQKAREIELAPKVVDSLGNLCLISRRANSRLSDRDVKEKVKTYRTARMGAKRQIMYSITESDNYEWGQEHIEEHYASVMDLLSKCRQILL